MQSVTPLRGTVVVLAAVVLSLAGCDTPPPVSAPAPTTVTAAPSPTQTPARGTEADHIVCGKLGTAADEFDFSVDTNRTIAAEAMRSTTEIIRIAGRGLDEATRSTLGGRVDAPTIGKAQITFAATCSALFGDGNW